MVTSNRTLTIEYKPLSQSAGTWQALFASGGERSPLTSLDWYRALCRNMLDRDPAVMVISNSDRPVALLPAEVHHGTLCMIQDERVSDHADILIEPGYDDVVMSALAAHIEECDLMLDLFPLKPTSTIPERLPSFIDGISLTDLDTCPFLALPASWEEYLRALTGKLRHELRRKMKRGAGLRLDHDQSLERFGSFLDLMARSDKEKRCFLNDRMRSFFYDIATSFAQHGWLRMCYASLDNEPIAALFSFQQGHTVYLYNSGYDPRHTALAPGIVAIAHDISRAIDEGYHTYDFLRGKEDYKLRLGARLRSTVRVQR